MKFLRLLLFVCSILFTLPSFSQLIFKKRQHLKGFQIDLIHKTKDHGAVDIKTGHQKFTCTKTALPIAETPVVIHKVASSASLELAAESTVQPIIPEQNTLKNRPQIVQKIRSVITRNGAGLKLDRMLFQPQPEVKAASGDGSAAAIIGFTFLMAAIFFSLVALVTQTSAIATMVFPFFLLSLIFAAFGTRSSRAALAKFTLWFDLILVFIALLLLILALIAINSNGGMLGS